MSATSTTKNSVAGAARSAPRARARASAGDRLFPELELSRVKERCAGAPPAARGSARRADKIRNERNRATIPKFAAHHTDLETKFAPLARFFSSVSLSFSAHPPIEIFPRRPKLRLSNFYSAGSLEILEILASVLLRCHNVIGSLKSRKIQRLF